MNYILFDGVNRNDLLPLTFTRPVADIRIGILTIREKWEKYLKVLTGVKTEESLSKKFHIAFSIDDDNTWINGCVCPNQKLLQEINILKPGQALYSTDILLAANSGAK